MATVTMATDKQQENLQHDQKWHDAPELLTTTEAAALLGLSLTTLARGRMENDATAPPFRMLGPRTVRYAKRDLFSWLNSGMPAGKQNDVKWKPRKINSGKKRQK